MQHLRLICICGGLPAAAAGARPASGSTRPSTCQPTAAAATLPVGILHRDCSCKAATLTWFDVGLPPKSCACACTCSVACCCWCCRAIAFCCGACSSRISACRCSSARRCCRSRRGEAALQVKAWGESARVSLQLQSGLSIGMAAVGRDSSPRSYQRAAHRAGAARQTDGPGRQQRV